jgi:anthranilate synthase component 1
MGTSPRAAWRLTDGVVEEWAPESGWGSARTPADPLADRERVASEYTPVEEPEIGDFWSGAVGFFSYDVVRYIERLPSAPPRTLDVPDALFLLTRALVIVDNLRSLARVVVGVPVPAGTSDAELRALHDGAVGEIEHTIARLRAAPQLAPLTLDAAAPPAQGSSNYDRERFMADVRRIK